MTRSELAPEALGERPLLPHNRYTHAGSATSLNDVRVEHGTASREHGVYAPTGNGTISNRLRRYGLALSRVKFPNAKKQAKSWGVSPQSIDAASTLVATHLYRNAYGDDPTQGTMSVAPLAQMLNEDNPHSSLFLEALSYAGTKAFDDLLTVVKPEVREVLETYKDSAEYYPNSRLRYLLGINSDNKYRRNHARRMWRDLARVLDGASQSCSNSLRSKTKQAEHQRKRKRLSSQFGNGKPIDTSAELTGWYPLFVSKPDLDIPHTGKLGRRNIYTNEGKYPRNIGRMITDPERRIFSRKTRSLGAVVVIDCSGSMNLTDYDLAELMKSSAGATVVCYSTGHRADEEHPNAWVVARKGRQVRHLPEFPGGNGCDAPALAYGVGLRSSSSQPVIWVSDGAVTGLGDVNSHSLELQCKRIVQRYGIHHVYTVNEAVRLMKKLQGGKS